MHAVRNIRLCTKDCVCLFVCPTGATDTENGQIDAANCLDGCRRCVDACPSHAISLSVDNYPVRPPKDPIVAKNLLAYMHELRREEKSFLSIAGALGNKKGASLAKALAHSTRIIAEDCAREAGYLIPQSEKAKELLSALLEEKPSTDGKEFPQVVIRELLAKF